MKKFITNVVLLVIVLFAVFYLFDTAITNGLRKSDMITYSNMTKIVNGAINADLIINGSSKAYVQVSPKILDSVLQLNSYNLGLDGTPFIPQKLQYELYEDYNKSPEIVVQIVSNGTLQETGINLYNYIKFAPYLNIEKVSTMTKMFKGFTFVDYHLPLLRYSGNPLEVIDGLLSLFNVHLSKAPLEKGYLVTNRVWDGSFEQFKKDNKEGINVSLDAQACALFEEYIKNCKSKNTEVIMVYPPVYHEFVPYVRDREKLIAYYTEVSEKYNVPFLDFSQDEDLTFDTKYFYNSQHLNKAGTEIFTRKLGAAIKVRTQNSTHLKKH